MNVESPEGFKPGTLLNDGWVVEEPLREGATGVELRCHHRDDPTRKAAVKVFQDKQPTSWGRFMREAQILAKVDHPAMLRAEASRLDADPPYIVLHLQDGPDLRTVIEKSGALPPTQALAIARDLADLLAHLHARAIYHRDLQPSSILLAASGPVVMQLGIAREEGTGVLTTPGTLLGDVRYAPPEWSKPKDLRPQQWDLYALGMTLYAMLTGVEAFDVDPTLSAVDRALALTKAKLVHPGLDPGDGFPEGIRSVVGALTASDAADRPPTARQVHHRIRELIESLGGDPDAAAGPAPSLEGRSELPTEEAHSEELPLPEPLPDRSLVPPVDVPKREKSKGTDEPPVVPAADEVTAEDPDAAPDPAPPILAPAPPTRRGMPTWAPIAVAIVGALAVAVGGFVMAVLAAIAAYVLM